MHQSHIVMHSLRRLSFGENAKTAFGVPEFLARIFSIRALSAPSNRKCPVISDDRAIFREFAR